MMKACDAAPSVRGGDAVSPASGSSSAIPISDAERTSWGRKGRARRGRGPRAGGAPPPACQSPGAPGGPACARRPRTCCGPGARCPRAAPSEIAVAFTPPAIRRVVATQHGVEPVRMHLFIAPGEVDVPVFLYSVSDPLCFCHQFCLLETVL